jgi:biotin carboxylase
LDKPKVLVVGTTADYIQWIRHRCPGRALFLTSPDVRRESVDPAPAPEEEIQCNLSDPAEVRQALSRHLAAYHLELDGIACFDCESMELTAGLAIEARLPYPSPNTVRNCRNKFWTKKIWRACHLTAPAFQCVYSRAEAIRFFKDLRKPCVLKPLNGSGSELLLLAHSADRAGKYYCRIQQGLMQRRENRLYESVNGQHTAVLMEEYIQGDEYSCDFIIDNGHVQLIRLTRKIPALDDGPFGTICGYLLCSAAATGIAESLLLETLMQCAHALGIERSFCMLDFMMSGGRMVLIELSPRPGGDCLPALLRAASGLDILSLYLDFCQRRPFVLPGPIQESNYVGLRLHAHKEGKLNRIDTHRLECDARVRDLQMIRREGHQITMPPADYSSWLLGHIIFHAFPGVDPELQCRMLTEQFEVEIC